MAMWMQGNWSLNVRGAYSCGLQECGTAFVRPEEKDCVAWIKLSPEYLKGKDGAGSGEGLAKQRRWLCRWCLEGMSWNVRSGRLGIKSWSNTAACPWAGLLWDGDWNVQAGWDGYLCPGFAPSVPHGVRAVLHHFTFFKLSQLCPKALSLRQ